ncbi:MbtH family protein [Streptomyces sp. NPDC014894]|uniref:MbtH family protein n=1 Tax=Streptomyces sp. NPDC014894 TaxID=3364931 RepID=UPI003702E42B
MTTTPAHEEAAHQADQLVVRNQEEQYSIWPAGRDLPAGWEPTGFAGGEEACLAHIDQVWTDMRPKSLRDALAAARQDDGEPAGDPLRTDALDGPDLVTRLSAGDHRVELVLRPEPTPERLRRALEDRYVHLLFPGTEGGAELGIALTDRTELSGADLDAATGTVTLVGELTLDFTPVECVARLDLATRTGTCSLARR